MSLSAFLDKLLIFGLGFITMVVLCILMYIGAVSAAFLMFGVSQSNFLSTILGLIGFGIIGGVFSVLTYH